LSDSATKPTPRLKSQLANLSLTLQKAGLRKEVRMPVFVLAIIVVAIGALLLVGQFLPLVMNRDSPSADKDGLYLSGTETIKVMAPDGKVVSTWTGPDPLSNVAINAIAACVPGSSGGSTNPVSPADISQDGGCSSWINAMAIVFAPASYPFIGGTCSDNAGAETENGFSVTGCQATTTATNVLTPLGCNSNGITLGGQLCTGWITSATFGPGTFTATNCIYDISQTPCAIVNVDAGTLTTLTTYGSSEGFDYLNPTPIPVAVGDSVLVTIQFTVS
jgi:hypothetical protein